MILFQKQTEKGIVNARDKAQESQPGNIHGKSNGRTNNTPTGRIYDRHKNKSTQFREIRRQKMGDVTLGNNNI